MLCFGNFAGLGHRLHNIALAVSSSPSICHCENDFGTKVTSEVGVTWYFDRTIQRPFLRAKWLNFDSLQNRYC